MKNYCETIESSVLGRSISVRFIVPEGENLPCLFLLHGYGGDHNQWYEKSRIEQPAEEHKLGDEESRIVQLAEEHKLVVVAPGCGDGFYEDTREDMPRFLGEELVAYVRRMLPVSDAREHTYIADYLLRVQFYAKYPCCDWK